MVSMAKITQELSSLILDSHLVHIIATELKIGYFLSLRKSDIG